MRHKKSHLDYKTYDHNLNDKKSLAIVHLRYFCDADDNSWSFYWHELPRQTDDGVAWTWK